MPSFRLSARHQSRLDRRHFLAGSALAAAGLTRGAGAQDPSPRGHGLLATPSAGAPSALVDLLSLVPESVVLAHPDSPLLWSWADIARQLAWFGIPQEFTGDLPEGYLNATHPLAMGSNIFNFALVEEFTSAIGFEPLRVDRVLTAGAPPGMVSAFQGGIDLDALPETWTASGYAAVDTAGGTYWSLGDDLDLQHPIQNKVIGQLNHVTVTGDTVMASGNAGFIEAMLAGPERSLVDDARISPALGTLPENLVSAAAVDATIMVPNQAVGASADFDASDAAVGPMPQALGLLLGITEGLTVIPPDEEVVLPTPDTSAGEGVVVARLVMASPDDAAQAARVVEHRWNTWSTLATREPFSDLMALQDASSSGEVALFTFTNQRAPRAWYSIVLAGDILPFAARP